MPHVDPFMHRPTDAELENWDESFEYSDHGMTAAKIIRTLIRELKAERARAATVIEARERALNRAGGNALRYGATHRTQWHPHPQIDREPNQGFARIAEIEAEIRRNRGGLRDPAIHRPVVIDHIQPLTYAREDAAFTLGMRMRLMNAEELKVGERIETHGRTDIPVMYGHVLSINRKKKSVKVGWDDGTEGYISMKWVCPSAMPDKIEDFAENYEID